MTNELHRVGHGQGTPLIFIHGYSVDHRLLLPLEPIFTHCLGWQRIYLDLPGHGRSPADLADPTADAIATAVAGTVSDLAGNRPFAICGSSFGGQVARDLVARFGDQVMGLALIAPVVVPQLLRRRGMHRQFTGPGPSVDLTGQDPDIVAQFTAIAVEHTATAWADFTRYVAPGLASHDRAYARQLLQSFDLTTPPEQRFATFDHPALMITGRQDAGVGYVDQFDLLSSYPRMTYVALDHAGHNVHLDRPKATHALFADWLHSMKCEQS